jgi:hypothetical protein
LVEKGDKDSRSGVKNYGEVSMLEFLTETTLSIPMIQIILLMLISTLSLLFGKIRLALLVNYIFILNWAYILNRELLMGSAPTKFQYLTAGYFGFGILIVMIAVFSFLFQKDQD